MNRTWLKLQSAIHRRVYQISGGKIGSYFGAPTLLLTTIGRKSQKARTTPLFYLEHGEDWIVTATNAGSDKPPAWWLNLQANPSAHIQVKGDQFDVSIGLIKEDERATIWESFVELFAGYADYQNQTNREFPIIRLSRRG